MALKVMAPALAGDAAFAERFRREARLLASIDHPNVIGVFEAGEAEGRLYLTMRWVQGTDLASRLAGGGGLEPAHALAIADQVAAGLDAAHERGLVHRDVKPANVLLEGERAYLSDFGAVRDLRATEGVTATGQWLGTVDYVAPELLDGEPPTPRSDVYSLGCVLFEALTGRPPHRHRNDVDTLWAHRHASPPALRELRPDLPAALDAAVGRALAKRPEERPASAGALVRAARAALARAGATQPGARTVASPRPAGPEGGWRRLALPAVAVLAAGVAAVIAFGDGEEPREATAPAAPAPPPRVDRIALGPKAGAGALEADASGAFVLDPVRREVVKILSSTRQLSRISLRGAPRGLDLSPDGRRLWIGLSGRRLQAIDLARGRPAGRPIRLGVNPAYVAALPDRVAVLSNDDTGGRLQFVDPARRRPAGESIAIGGAPTDLVASGDEVLALLAFPPTLLRYDARGRRTGETPLEAGGFPPELALDARGTAWLSVFDAGLVALLDPGTGRPGGKPIGVGPRPQGIAVDGNSVWVASRGDATVSRIDVETGAVVGRPVAAGELSGEIAAAAGVAWASSVREVVRIEPVP